MTEAQAREALYSLIVLSDIPYTEDKLIWDGGFINLHWMPSRDGMNYRLYITCGLKKLPKLLVVTATLPKTAHPRNLTRGECIRILVDGLSLVEVWRALNDEWGII